MSIKAETLIGKTFGKLKVIDIAYKGRSTYMLCQCECGNTAAIRLSHLTSGHTKSCGCIKHDRGEDSLFSKAIIDGALNSTTIRVNNRSGYTGVSWSKSKRKWKAELMYGGNRQFLGYYSNINDAIISRTLAVDKIKTQSHLIEN